MARYGPTPLPAKLLLAALLVCHVGGLACAQEAILVPPVPLSNDPVVAPQPFDPAENEDAGNLDEVYGRLEQLKQQRRAAVADVQAMQQSTLQYDSSRQRINRDIASLRRQMERNAATSSRQSERIREKLDRLRKLAESGGFCRTDAAHEIPGDHAASQAPHTNASRSEQTAPIAIQDPSPENNDATANDDSQSHAPAEPSSNVPTADPPFPKFAPKAMRQSPEASDSKELPESLLKALAMVDGPVDSLRLANNLYGTGEFQLALEIYQKVDRGSLTDHQQIWIEYQIANCYRQLGNRSLAERSYRIVVSRDKDGWIGQNSRWWLDVGEKTTSLNQSIQAIGQAIDQLQQQEAKP